MLDRSINSVLLAGLSIAASFLLTECVQEGREHHAAWETDNVTLHFSLEGGGSFADRVHSVHVGIFDDAGNFLRAERVDRAEISRYGSTALTLAPGGYRLIFWGNLDEAANLVCTCGKCGGKRVGHWDDCCNGECGDRLCVIGGAGDLYYAPGGGTAEYYPLTVGRRRETHQIVFTPAYRSLGVFIKGLPADKLPDVVIEGLPAGLNYSGMTPCGATLSRSHRTEAVKANGTRYAAATFRTFRFDNDDNIQMVVKDQEKELFRTPLAEAPRDADTSTGFVLDFTGVDVTVTMPDWVDVQMDVLFGKYKPQSE